MRFGSLLALSLFASGFHPCPASAEPVAHDVDKVKSVVVAVTHRSGLLGFLGHEHAILADRWFINLRIDERNLQGSSVDAIIPTASLVVDSPEARRTAELTSGGPDADDIKKIQRKMLGPEVLDAFKHSDIRFKAVTIAPQKGEAEVFAVDGLLTIKGVSRPVKLDVTLSRGRDESYRFRGRLEFKQTDFGIDPVSIAGVVNVRNEMEIRFDIVTRPRSGFAGRPTSALARLTARDGSR